jgi:hypothetical protein
MLFPVIRAFASMTKPHLALCVDYASRIDPTRAHPWFAAFSKKAIQLGYSTNAERPGAESVPSQSQLSYLPAM